MKTERLYYADSHLREFDARVEEIRTSNDGRTGVVLDRTAFYPTGGGQPFDTGAIDAARVVDCFEDDEQVVHIIEGQITEAGARVRASIDWPRRLEHIQQHTGQHILSQSFVELFGAQTRSFRMMTDASEIDVELQDASDEKIERAVNRANEIVWDDRAVTIHHVTPERAAEMPLRKDSAREGELRVIEIEGFDFSPCGGTHARRTGEVGLVAVRQWERAKGLTRVTFVAGIRALEDYRRANRTARNVAAAFSAGRDEATGAVARLIEEHKQTLRRIRELSEIAARTEARELIEEAARASADVPLIVARVFDGRDAEELKQLAFALIKHTRTIALLGSRDATGARIVFARSPELTTDMNALVREACVLLEGRGGGRADLAQGGGPRVESLDQTIEAAAKKVSS